MTCDKCGCETPVLLAYPQLDYETCEVCWKTHAVPDLIHLSRQQTSGDSAAQ